MVSLLHYTRLDPADANKLVTYATMGTSYLAVVAAAVAVLTLARRQCQRGKEEANLKDFTSRCKKDMWTAAQQGEADWDLALHRLGEYDIRALQTSLEMLRLEKITGNGENGKTVLPDGKYAADF